MATHADIIEALSRRHAPPEWAFVRNVGNATGYGQRRWADCVALNLWPSRGLELHGFEVKATRENWLKELKEPAKAEPFFKYMDRWWVVANRDVVKIDEVPIPWGLVEMRGQRFYTAKKAPLLEASPVDRTFLAALLRRATGGSAAVAEITAARRASYEKGFENAKQLVRRDEEHLRRRIRGLEKARDDFEAKSGIRISGWDGQRLGEAVALIRQLGSLRHSLERTHEVALEIVVDAQAALDNLDGEGDKARG